MKRKTLWRGLSLVAAGAVTVVALAGCDVRPDGFNSISPQGRSVVHLFVAILVISGVIAVLVAGTVVVAAVRFRARPGREARPSGRGTKLQIIWIGAPLLIMAVVSVFMIRTINTVVGNGSPSNLQIKVVGHQWWWEFDYPGGGVVTANELHVPIDTTMDLKLTSADVIHSFWVPEFGWKMDAIPSRTNTLTITVDKTGTFTGSCTEFCGEEHAMMGIKVIAEPLAQFDAWLAQQSKTAADPGDVIAQQGLGVFVTNTCEVCHAIRFNTGPTTTNPVGPDLTHFGSRTTIGSGALPNTPANLKAWITDADAIKPGAQMPSFATLTDAQINALVKYLEGLQ